MFDADGLGVDRPISGVIANILDPHHLGGLAIGRTHHEMRRDIRGRIVKPTDGRIVRALCDMENHILDGMTGWPSGNCEIAGVGLIPNSARVIRLGNGKRRKRAKRRKADKF